MRRTIAALTIAVALTAGLTACQGEDGGPTSVATPSSSPSVDIGDPGKEAEIPPAPTGMERAAYLAALKVIDPDLVVDEEAVIEAGREQCAKIDAPGHVDRMAVERFGTDKLELTEDQGRLINEALRRTLCKG